MKQRKMRKITRGGGRLTAFFLAAVSILAANAVESVVEYATPASGTASQSLADGKVQVVYDAEDKIARLAISPASGETLTLCGDALPFADGAAIVPGADGESVVSNAVSFAGAVSLGVRNLTWSGTLSSSEYTTVFENANLDDISPVSATVDGNENGLPEAGRPYFVTRSGSGANATMSVQFHTDWDGPVNSANNGSQDQDKIVLVELLQDGGNIKAKTVKSAHYDRTRLHGFDINGELSTASGRNTAKSYGISSLAFGPRYEYYFANVALSESDTVVASNAKLEEIEILYGLQGNLYGMMPFHVSYENGVMTAQLIQKWDSKGCVKIQLSQSGSDIAAKTLYAKSLAAWTDEDPPDYDVVGSAAAIGIKGLALRQKVKPRKLTFVSHGTTTLNAISGGNVDVTFKTLAADAPAATTTASLFPEKDTWKTFATGVKLGELDLTGVVIGGKYAGSAFAFVDFANNGTTATFQAQGNGGTILRVINVQLQQSGDDVQLKIDTPYYTQDAAKIAEYYGVKSLPSSESEGNNSVASGDDKRGLNIKTLTYTVTPAAFIYATGANTLEDSSLSFYGAGNNPLYLHVTDSSAFNAACPFDCRAETTMYIDDAATYRTGVVTDMTQTMHPGSILVTPQKFAFHRQNGKLVLDGATLLNTADEAYFNYIAFSNAASVASASGDLRAGGVASPVWTVGGEGMSTLEGNVRLVAIEGLPSLTIDVADVADGTDFLVAGDIVDFQSNNLGYMVKTGAGTMQLDGTATSTGGALSIAEGTLLLGTSSGTAHTDFNLAGGTLALADGTANTAGTLWATADSSLSVGSGASLTLADLAVSEGVTLNVSGAGRTGVKVASALSAATLTRITVDGARSAQTPDGYLRAARGFILFIR